VLPLDPQLIAAIDREGSRSSGGTVNPGFSPPLTIPPREISRVKPVYPEEARLARWTGVVVLECVINREGRVNPVRVFRSTGTMQSYDDLPRSLELSALRAVTLWRYEPATVEGRPVPTSLTVSVTFRLK
jgi:protein TonB